MRALSLRQPWVTAVLRLGKNVENRKWNTHYRGPFLLHAAKGMTQEDQDDALAFTLGVLGEARRDEVRALFQPDTLLRGGIVGVATLVDVVPPRADSLLLWGDASPYPSDVDSRWHMPVQYGFLLREIRPLPFHEIHGLPGFFEIPDEIARPLLEAT